MAGRHLKRQRYRESATVIVYVLVREGKPSIREVQSSFSMSAHPSWKE